MEENKNVTEPKNETKVITPDLSPAFDPIQALKELKENSVSKEKYEQVLAERDKYIKAIFDGEWAKETMKEEEPADIDALRKDLFTKDLTNLDFAKKALSLREAILDKDGIDIFVGRGEKITPTDDDYRAAQKVADGLKSCIEIAAGNPEIFTRELMRITQDAGVTKGIDPRIKH